MALPPPTAPPFLPKTGPSDGSLKTATDFFPSLLSESFNPIDKVVFPTKKIEQDIKACAEQVNQCKAELEKLEGVKNTYKAIADSTRGLTYEAFISKLKAFTSLFGLDLAALQAEVDSVAFPDPQKTGGALGEKVNKILRNKQYIKKVGY